MRLEEILEGSGTFPGGYIGNMAAHYTPNAEDDADSEAGAAKAKSQNRRKRLIRKRIRKTKNRNPIDPEGVYNGLGS